MESLEDIRKKHIKNLTADLGTMGRQLIELGWSREQVLAFITQQLEEPTGPTKEDRP
jgi:hypothetical protein